MKISPRTSNTSGKSFAVTRFGMLLIVSTLAVTFSPSVPSPRVAALTSRPFS